MKRNLLLPFFFRPTAVFGLVLRSSLSRPLLFLTVQPSFILRPIYWRVLVAPYLLFRFAPQPVRKDSARVRRLHASASVLYTTSRASYKAPPERLRLLLHLAALHALAITLDCRPSRRKPGIELDRRSRRFYASIDLLGKRAPHEIHVDEPRPESSFSSLEVHWFAATVWILTGRIKTSAAGQGSGRSPSSRYWWAHHRDPLNLLFSFCISPEPLVSWNPTDSKLQEHFMSAMSFCPSQTEGRRR
jgi:hypothetical protein